MSRGGSFGGGQSSLGYLFAPDEKKQENDPPLPSPPSLITPPYGVDGDPPPPSPPALITPPYGVDTVEENPPITPPPPPPTKEDQSPFNNYHRVDGQNSGNFLTGRPSTKVKSVPGGDSSLGYLFGDK